MLRGLVATVHTPLTRNSGANRIREPRSAASAPAGSTADPLNAGDHMLRSFPRRPRSGSVVLAVLIVAACKDASTAVCRPDDPGTRADVMALLTDEDKAGARERAGLTRVDPEHLSIVTDAHVCARLRRQFKGTYEVQGGKSPYVATFYRVDNRFIVHIIPREALGPASAPPGKVSLTQTKVLLLVYDESFKELRSLVM